MKSDTTPIVNFTRGTVVCEHAVIANNPLPRMRGLLGRQSLSDGEGLLLQPARSIHTAFMRFPIDVVFLDESLQVVKLVEQLPPWRTVSARRARTTLELASGEIAARGIHIDDSLAVVNLAGERVAVEAKPNASITTVPMSAGESRRGQNRRESDVLAAAESAVDDIRVLLVGKDRRFRSVAAALLTRRGCAVVVAERSANVADVVGREQIEVVVIDAGSSLTAATRDAGRIQALDRRLGVVLVREEREEGLSAMPVLAKWGSFDDLFGAIESVRAAADGRSSNGHR